MAKRTAKTSEGPKGKDLVIVESPAKAKTINKYLGPGFVVKASMGHVRDLPKKGMGVDLETFEPAYEIIEGRGKVITDLKKLARDAGTVWIATDLDREGEAIAWHLKEALKLPDDRVKRVIFNAITKAEIEKAFQQAGTINQDRVNAQQARRILDRVVGFEISPVLWRKVARGLSAGRVQSVAVRLIVEREREIEAFTPEEYWKIAAVFSTTDDSALRAAWHRWLGDAGEDGRTKKDQQHWLAGHEAFAAELFEFGGEKWESIGADAARRAAEALGLVIERVDEAEDPEGKGPERHRRTLIGRLGAAPNFIVEKVEKKRTKSRPPGPFITSTLQQAASSRLGFGAGRTMRIAQTLYEAGHITYMRTDSTHISGEALTDARRFIKTSFGDRYLPDSPNTYVSSNKGAQEAHEAIRPTDVDAAPDRMRHELGADDQKLYKLIWERFVACQMTPAEFDQKAISIAAPTKEGKALFRATGRRLVFDGFMRVAGISSEDQLLPELRENDPVFAVDIQPTQHFTSPPPRFTEASLVKALEELGIGRPSTYASIIDTIQKREYVLQMDRRFYATLLGKVVTDKLIQAFPEIMDVGFTAEMEGKLDAIEDRAVDWVKLLKDFYGPFHEGIGAALEKLEHAGGMPSPYVDEETGAKLVYRIGKNGFFLAAEDRSINLTKPVDAFGKPTVMQVSQYNCPLSGHPMIRRKGRFGEFMGCSGYPECQFIVPLDKQGEPLPPKAEPIETAILDEKESKPMLLRHSKRGPFLGSINFPKNRSTIPVKKLDEEQKRYIETLLPELRRRVQASFELVSKMTGKPSTGYGQLPELHISRESAKAAARQPPKKSSAA